MMAVLLQTGTFFGLSFDEPVIQLAMAAALGLFLGLEREWSDKPAGIRTFSLTSLLGAVFTIIATGTPYRIAPACCRGACSLSHRRC